MPKTTTTRTVLDSRVVTDRLPGEVAIRARAHDRRVVVHAERRDECVEETVEVQRIKRKREADLAVPHLGGGDDGKGALIVLTAAPSIQDSCDPLIRQWRAQTDPDKAGRLILKMQDRCRDPEVLQLKRSATLSATTRRETL